LIDNVNQPAAPTEPAFLHCLRPVCEFAIRDLAIANNLQINAKTLCPADSGG